jgi:hypothetical protein
MAAKHSVPEEQWDRLPKPVQDQWLLETSLGAPTEELKQILRWCLLDGVEPVPGTRWMQ